ncbi:MAG: site-specific DNA-methyltransferase [Planctomycetota bacterium]|jgi:DNA modification methylase|nr:site-specific DNA-methyltransferase [Planctomycetota bacterium]
MDNADKRPPGRLRPDRAARPSRPDSLPPRLEASTLWDFPSQNYGGGKQGDKAYAGATPAQIVWNLLQRYTRPGDLVVDPMAGGGTTLDVARELGRRALGYDLVSRRPDVFRADARKLPLEDGKAGFVFVDPPYSTHIDYSGDPACIGKLDAAGSGYYAALDLAIGEIHRVLAAGRHMALLVCDSFVKGEGFFPIGFELFARLRQRFEPVDIVAVARKNRTLGMANYRRAAEAGNFFLRGFNYLFIMRKGGVPGQERAAGARAAGKRGRHAGNRG